MNTYSHDLKEEKLFKVVLKGLHKIKESELISELKSVDLDPTDARIINPKNPASSMTSFTIKMLELLQRRVILHTIVQYKHTPGVVQCTRCQRSGHGARNCNMPPRCCLCGADHETFMCPVTSHKLKKAMKAGLLTIHTIKTYASI